MRTLDYRNFLLRHPDLFLLAYFPHTLRPHPDKTPQLEDFHERLINNAVEEVRSLTLYPAGHGKTTIISTLLPIWALCKDPNQRIAIIAKNEVDAKGIMRSIHAELLGNEKLIRDFGQFFPNPEDKEKAWSIERIDIAQRTVMRKEGSIQIYGSKGNVLGKRFDWVICDDVVTEKNSATPEQRGQMMEWFNLGVETMPEHPESRLTVVGTLFDPEDLYHSLRDLMMPETQETIYKLQREDAVADEENHLTLWPERWTWERLMAQKVKMGTLDFNKRYRNIAVDKSRIVFLHEYLWGGYIGKEKYPGCLDESFCVSDYADNWRRVSGFDPAIGVSKLAKFCAHLTLGMGSCVRHERCFWVIDLIRDQFTMPQQVELIIEQHLKYDLQASIIEVNGFQAGIKDSVELKCAETGQMITVLGHHTSRNNKPDPEIGVTGMAAMIENGYLHIPWGDQHSRRVMQQLLDELEMYPQNGVTSDTVMALWFAWKQLQELAPKYSSFNRLTPAGSSPSIFAKRPSNRAVRNPAYG